VASRDRDGRYGEFGFARRIFCEEEEPKDLLLAPAEAASVAWSETEKVRFSWQAAASTEEYRLRVFRGADMAAAPVIDVTTREQFHELSGLQPGEYHWGVWREGKTSRPIFLKPRQLTLRKVAKTKLSVPKAISSWGAPE
jgi:hypothetical protein